MHTHPLHQNRLLIRHQYSGLLPLVSDIGAAQGKTSAIDVILEKRKEKQKQKHL